VFRAGGHNSSIRTELNWVRKFDGGSKLDTRLGINRALNERAIRFFGMDKSSALLLDRATRTDIRVRGWTWTGKHSTPLVTGHALAGGWDAGDSRLGEGDVQTSVVYSPDQPRDFDNSYDARIKRIALYVQDEWDVTANWSLYLGARWEGMRIGLAGHGFAPGSSQYSVPSPLLQSLWKLPGSKGRQVRLALTRTYRAPPLAQLVPRRFYTSVSTPLTPDFYGNPDLKPELATGIDTAYEHYFASGAMVSVSGAARTIDGYIRNTVRQEGARWISMPSNQGKAHVRNLELEAKLPLKALYADAPQIDWRSSISRNWSRVDGVPGPDNRLDRQPEWSVSMGADYTRGAFKAGASYSFVSSGWTRSSLIRMDYFGARRDLEAYALVKFGPASQLRFTALNLLRPTGLSAKTYRDSLSREDSLAENPGYRGWRLQYEHKL
jgi:outer membrane receptor protein involved in Fe transport